MYLSLRSQFASPAVWDCGLALRQLVFPPPTNLDKEQDENHEKDSIVCPIKFKYKQGPLVHWHLWCEGTWQFEHRSIEKSLHVEQGLPVFIFRLHAKASVNVVRGEKEKTLQHYRGKATLANHTVRIQRQTFHIWSVFHEDKMNTMLIV